MKATITAETRTVISTPAKGVVSALVKTHPRFAPAVAFEGLRLATVAAKCISHGSSLSCPSARGAEAPRARIRPTWAAYEARMRIMSSQDLGQKVS